MALAEDIRARVLAYLAGDTTLRDFEDWLTEETWDVHSHDPEAADVAYAVKRLIAEHTSGYRTEDDLKRSLVPLVQAAWVRAWRGVRLDAKPSTPLVLQTVS